VALAPLRVARGVQNKVLEAMAMGVPVVATPAVAASLTAAPGLDLLVGDGAAAFARAVGDVMTNARLRTALAGAARAFVDRAPQRRHRRRAAAVPCAQRLWIAAGLEPQRGVRRAARRRRRAQRALGGGGGDRARLEGRLRRAARSRRLGPGGGLADAGPLRH